MTEKSDQTGLTSRIPIKISRRQLFKLAAQGSGLYAATKALDALVPFEAQIPPINIEVIFDPSKHTLAPSVFDYKPNILAGELTAGDVDIYYAGEHQPIVDKSPFDEFFDFVQSPQTHSSENDLRDNSKTLKAAYSQDIPIVAMDEKFMAFLPADHFQQMEQTISRANANFLSAITLTSVALGGFANLLLNMKSNQEEKSYEAKKNLWSGISIGSTSGIALLLLLYANDLISEVDETIFQAQGDIKNQLLGRAIKRGRNFSMTQNLFMTGNELRVNQALAQTMLSEGQDKLKIVFRVGQGHYGIPDIYKKGEVYTTDKLHGFAQDIIRYIKFGFHDAKTDEERADFMNIWQIFTFGFSYPIPSYADRPEYQQGQLIDYMPDSARAILWKELISVAKTEPNDQGLRAMTGTI